MKRRSSALLLSVVLGTTVAACADVDVGATATDGAIRTVTVRPRVVVDGTVELADRSHGRLSVDAIIAHADGARVVARADDDDVVDSDSAPVFFSFAPDTIDDQIAAQRDWQVPVEGGVIAMAFGPADSVDASIAGTDGLLGHTALIHGTITIAVDDIATGETANDSGEIDPDGSPAKPTSPTGGPDDVNADAGAVDPDGTPAKPIKGAVDPDGTPARPTSPAGDPDDVGAVAVKNGEIDPDGSPARPGNGGLISAVDPDGTPARPVKGEVDPDGSPARSTKRHAMKLNASAAAKEARAGGFARSGEIRVPFTLVVDGAFAYEAAIDAAALADVGADEVLSLDLRIAATDIFTAERIGELQQLARASLHASTGQSLVVAMTASSTAPALEVSVSHAVRVDQVNLEEAPQVDAQMVISAVR